MLLNIIMKHPLMYYRHAVASCVLCALAFMISACNSGFLAAANAAGMQPKVSSESPTPSYETCPVTQPPAQAFTPPAPYPSSAPDGFWYGTPALWIDMPSNGIWSGLPHNHEGYTQKIFWWHEGYSTTKEPFPDLQVSGQRLDASAPPLHVSQATNASSGDIYSAMLVGADFPTLGCWQITGHYADIELSFVVQITP